MNLTQQRHQETRSSAAKHRATVIPLPTFHEKRRTPPRAGASGRCCPDLGLAFRNARLDAGLTQRQLAAKARTTPSQVSLVESGYNHESQFYARLAHALGFRSARDVIQGQDAATRRLLRLWAAMDHQTRELAYKKLRVWLLED